MNDQRAARRRAQRAAQSGLSPFKPGSPYGLVVGVAHDEHERVEVRKDTATQLAEELGDRQVGPAMWIEVAGNKALEYLAELCAMSPAMQDRQPELEQQLAEWPDGILVVAVAERKL